MIALVQPPAFVNIQKRVWACRSPARQHTGSCTICFRSSVPTSKRSSGSGYSNSSSSTQWATDCSALGRGHRRSEAMVPGDQQGGYEGRHRKNNLASCKELWRLLVCSMFGGAWAPSNTVSMHHPGVRALPGASIVTGRWSIIFDDRFITVARQGSGALPTNIITQLTKVVAPVFPAIIHTTILACLLMHLHADRSVNQMQIKFDYLSAHMIGWHPDLAHSVLMGAALQGTTWQLSHTRVAKY